MKNYWRGISEEWGGGGGGWNIYFLAQGMVHRIIPRIVSSGKKILMSK